MAEISFNSENLKVDWISFNLTGLANTRIIADRLSNYFTPHVTIDGKPEIKFHDFREKYKVSIHQYMGSKGYWIGTKISFSGKNADYFYKLLKTQDLDWSLLKFKEHNISLGQIDLCFSLMNGLSQTNKSFDKFLVDCRSHIQDHTNTKYIKLQDFPNGKMLKINRRNNSLHYRVYENNQEIRFELEMKSNRVQSVQDFLFNHQIPEFEQILTKHFYNYSTKILVLDQVYTDWLIQYLRRKEKQDVSLLLPFF